MRSVTDGSGNTTEETFLIVISDPADTTAPVITPINDQVIDAGNPIDPIRITVDDPSATIVVRGLPSGVNYDPSTGIISGTPDEAGEYEVTVTVTDASGNQSTETFIITRLPLDAPTGGYLPNTGSSDSTVVLILGMILAAIGVVVLRRPRRQSN